MSAPRVLLLIPTSSYRASDFLAAAGSLGVEVVVASEEPNAMEKLQPAGFLTLDFLDPVGAAEQAAAFHRQYGFQAVIPVDEETAVVAAEIGKAVGLPHNTPEAAGAARLKHRMRDLLSKAGVPVPGFSVFSLNDSPAELAKRACYPCVLKPIFLSGSRGVIRADDEGQFIEAFHRLEAILREPDLVLRGGELAREFLVEDYIDGSEVALDALLSRGKLEVLALFDKPDPLEGPYFEETLYVTPSRLDEGLQAQLADRVAEAALAMGLRHGPVHAELRWNDSGIYVIEIAGRSIGGLCSRTLHFGLGMSLEELLIRHALGMEIEGIGRESKASGVMMIPIPKSGYLKETRGIAEAEKVAGIEQVTITAHPGKMLAPLPEGSSYLGFILARADTADDVEKAIRQAHHQLEFVIEPTAPAWLPGGPSTSCR